MVFLVQQILEKRVKITHNLLYGLLLAGRRSEQPLAVASFQEDDPDGPAGVLVLVVEQQVLVEPEPPQQPLGAVGAPLIQIARVTAVVPAIATRMYVQYACTTYIVVVDFVLLCAYVRVLLQGEGATTG